MVLNLAENSSLLVLMGMHLSHLLEESDVCGGQCLKDMYKAAKLRSRDGDGRLGCSRSNWWNRRSHKRSSISSLRYGHWWYSLYGELALLWRGGTRGATMGGAPEGAE